MSQYCFETVGRQNIFWKTFFYEETFILWLGFFGPSRLFHSFWAESMVRGWGSMGDPREKKTHDHLQAEIGLSHIWPKLGSKSERWDDKRFRALKISNLNHSATGRKCLHSNVSTYSIYMFFTCTNVETLMYFHDSCLLPVQMLELWWRRKPKALSLSCFCTVNDLVLLYTYFNHFWIPLLDPVLPGRFLFDVCLISPYIYIYIYILNIYMYIYIYIYIYILQVQYRLQ